MPLPKEFVDLFGKFGFDRKSLLKIRFGGVIGKQALVGIGGMAGLIVVALKSQGNPPLLWGCLAGFLLLPIVVVTAMGFHGHKHPAEATLEGAEVVMLQHLQQQVAAKGMPELPASAPVLEGIGSKPTSMESAK